MASKKLESVALAVEPDGLADAEIVFRNLEREDVPFRDDRRFAELDADDVAFEGLAALLDSVYLRFTDVRENAANQVAGRRNGARSNGTLQKQNHFLPHSAD